MLYMLYIYICYICYIYVIYIYVIYIWYIYVIYMLYIYVIYIYIYICYIYMLYIYVIYVIYMLYYIYMLYIYICFIYIYICFIYIYVFFKQNLRPSPCLAESPSLARELPRISGAQGRKKKGLPLEKCIFYWETWQLGNLIWSVCFCEAIIFFVGNWGCNCKILQVYQTLTQLFEVN